MVTENATIASGRRDAATDALKIPPHSIEAEQSVLGGLMLFMAVDATMSNGFAESWYYFLFGGLAFVMYFLRRRMRLKQR